MTVPPAQGLGGTRRARAATGRREVALLAAVLGALILFAVGLAAPAALHEAAHDARHSLGLPCH